ncbi:MAG: hypothetical protein MPJ50_16065 [Pirellulales bacterium]|nr:hypothetical protein [Pirellulales bacterium]
MSAGSACLCEPATDSTVLFQQAIDVVSELTALAQQPLDVSSRFSDAFDLVHELPLTKVQQHSVVRGLRIARKLQAYREFGAARHELDIVRRSLTRCQLEQ